MITFKYLVRKDKKRADGTWNVCIRVTYGGKVRYMPTAMYVTKKDLTPKFAIKNYQVIDRCETLVATYRKRAMELDLELNRPGIDVVMERIERKGELVGETFTAFALRWIDECGLKGAKNYLCALHALQRMLGREVVLFADVTAHNLRRLEQSLKGKPRAQSQYTTALMKMFNDARDYYNDEDGGEVLIAHSLRKYHAPRQNVARKRAHPGAAAGVVQARQPGQAHGQPPRPRPGLLPPVVPADGDERRRPVQRRAAGGRNDSVQPHEDEGPPERRG